MSGRGKVLKLFVFALLVKYHVSTTRQNYQGCILPQHPPFGQWTIYQASYQSHPGEVVPLGTLLEVGCQNEYKLNAKDIVACVRGIWKPKIGDCLRTCPSIHSTISTKVSCTYNYKKLKSCKNVLNGTIAQFECSPFYEDQELVRDPFRICSNGTWSGAIPECVPACGQKSPAKALTLIVGGSNVTRGDYPWQVALYKGTDKNLICGGSLLNQRVILTAAHCVTDDNAKLFPKKFYTIAAGKYFRKYNDSRDFDKAQFSSVHKIYIPRQYKGDTQNYFGDIAIIVTKKSFVLSERVQPVCVDWGSKHYEALLDPTRTKYGFVSGWGFTVEHKNPSEVLKHLQVPLISDEQCNKKLPKDHTQYMTDDKLCAGFLGSGISVCSGDSGGGLVSKYGSRYYLVGVVSLAPRSSTREGGCNSQQYALYTKVSYYIQNFILEKEARFRPNSLVSQKMAVVLTPSSRNAVKNSTKTTPSVHENGCILPDYPRFGTWIALGTSSEGLVPGFVVPHRTILKIACTEGYKLQDNSTTIQCHHRTWSSKISQCVRKKECPSRISTAKMRVTCTYKNKELENCTNPADGTIARFQCAPFYQDSGLGRQPVHVCRNGKWNQKEPNCVPVCGQEVTLETTSVIPGSLRPNRISFYPWQAAIYNANDKTLICGGSLLSEKVILTAAHCITDSKGDLIDKEHYLVTVGTYFRRFNDSRNDKEAQVSGIANMFIPEEYQGDNRNYFSNVAVLITVQSFTLSKKVQPVCLGADGTLRFRVKTLSYVKLMITWGYSYTSWILPDRLKTISVPSLSLKDCQDYLPQRYQKYLIHDKFCAAFLRNGNYTCQGSGGGGLVYNHDGRFYLGGVVSKSPTLSMGLCQHEEYHFYTNVSNYLHFILPKLEPFRV